ncbi:MAG: HlyD family efflux transporter periplasmic adaptor subunit [Acidobacteriaceae bacterium]|nr:HlyD family efflux transporter periplasmic adaptor subunit [Acidobacteriaceae bacterium]MBV9767769.1 HlyD family efflux transporter periplasmic adaptor subunit [Acidobacteriaceae bacterium]
MAMDVPRGKEVARKRLIRRIALGVIAAIVVGGATVALARLKPAAPAVDMSGLWPGTVKKGPMERQVRGLGALKPQEIHFIAAAQDSRVATVVRRAGLDAIHANDVILTLSDPDLELEAEKAEWQVKQEEANLANMRVKLQSDKLDQKANLAQLESQYTQAKLTADRDLELTRLNLKSDLESKLSVDQATQFQNRVGLQKQRLDIDDQAIKAQIDAQEVVVASARAAYELKRKQVDQLTIRAGIDGVLQEVDVEVGQRVPAGTILAKVADPTKLKAVLQISENQMKDVRVGLDATIDTRNGLIPGRVIRIDPAALNGTVGVDVALLGTLPQGARAELSVDGIVEIERLLDVLYVDRPVSGEADSTIGLFKIDPDGKGATRVNVKFGRTSVNYIEVLDGLKVGDRVILSDMSQYEQYPRIRLNT